MLRLNLSHLERDWGKQETMQRSVYVRLLLLSDVDGVTSRKDSVRWGRGSVIELNSHRMPNVSCHWHGRGFRCCHRLQDDVREISGAVLSTSHTRTLGNHTGSNVMHRHNRVVPVVAVGDKLKVLQNW